MWQTSIKRANAHPRLHASKDIRVHFCKYKKYVTKDLVSRMAAKLAGNPYFGESGLAVLTVTGNQLTKPLEMKEAIRMQFVQELATDF